MRITIYKSYKEYESIDFPPKNIDKIRKRVIL